MEILEVGVMMFVELKVNDRGEVFLVFLLLLVKELLIEFVLIKEFLNVLLRFLVMLLLKC